MSLSVACEVKVTSGVTASSLSTGVAAGKGMSSAVAVGIRKLMLGGSPILGGRKVIFVRRKYSSTCRARPVMSLVVMGTLSSFDIATF